MHGRFGRRADLGRTMRTVALLTAGLLLLTGFGVDPAAPAGQSLRAAVAVTAAAGCPTTGSPATAVGRAAANARASGVTEAISVVKRSTGAVVGTTSNANSQIGSESIMKLFLAAYYLVLYGGYQKTPGDVKTRLSYMLRYSDDATASSLFTASAIPSVAARYGLSRTTNATDRAGHWGAARITARDMTTFLYRASKDGAVGPWLIPVMAQTAASGSDGFNQKFGLNALSGTHGSKQGWGNDSFFTSPTYAIHSVGYTSGLFVSVLQIGPASTYPDPMRATATYAARTIQSADASASALAGASVASGTTTASGGGSSGVISAVAAPAIANGTFIRISGHTEVYRVAGGAPLYVVSWRPWKGKAQPVHTVTQAQFNTLRARPADGTYIRALPSTRVYRVAGGSALWVSTWNAVGGRGSPTDVDIRALTRAGSGGSYNHLSARPADGTFIRTYADRRVYRFAGGAPLPVTSWSAVGGTYAATVVDAGVANSSGSSYWTNVSMRPASGTFLRAKSTGKVFVIAGGGPIYVPSWACLGSGARPTVLVDAAVISHGGGSGIWRHLLFYPNGTFVRGYPSGKVYRVANGKPSWVRSWAGYGGPHPTVLVPQISIDWAGMGGGYEHLKPLG
jgi:hypothetical protein